MNRRNQINDMILQYEELSSDDEDILMLMHIDFSDSED